MKALTSRLDFQEHSADRIGEVLLGLLKDRRSQFSDMPVGDSVWLNRAEAYLTAVLAPLLWLRDHEGWVVSPCLLTDALTFEGMLGLVCMRSIPDTERGELTRLLEIASGNECAFCGGRTTEQGRSHAR